jgi:predicted amidohydrolase
VLVSPQGKLAMRYRKVHPDAEWCITPGKELAPVDTPLGRLGMLICSDRNTVDNWSTLGVQGVEAVLLPMNGGGGPENTAVLRQRARDNGCAVVVANSWSSVLIGPLGEVYLERYESECVSVGRLYVAHAPKGEERQQFIGRRPDLYGPLQRNLEPQPMFDEQGEPTAATLAMRTARHKG